MQIYSSGTTIVTFFTLLAAKVLQVISFLSLDEVKFAFAVLAFDLSFVYWEKLLHVFFIIAAKFKWIICWHHDIKVFWINNLRIIDLCYIICEGNTVFQYRCYTSTCFNLCIFTSSFSIYFQIYFTWMQGSIKS